MSKKIEEKPAQDDLDIFNPILISNTKKASMNYRNILAT